MGALVEVRVQGLPASGSVSPSSTRSRAGSRGALFSVPGVRGVEFGDGFAAARMRGSGAQRPASSSRTAGPPRNGAGGVNGGITNGNELVVRDRGEARLVDPRRPSGRWTSRPGEMTRPVRAGTARRLHRHPGGGGPRGGLRGLPGGLRPPGPDLRRGAGHQQRDRTDAAPESRLDRRKEAS
ncbi:MAG: chorismate synthase [Candidatus Moduliflexus flocculans]|nr:chorismate synthase [Candidatus Moduliflexus flocculans]